MFDGCTVPWLMAVMHLLLCRSFDELRMMQLTLQAYRADHFPQLILAFCVLYLFMQCFTIPGCFFLTVLLGSLLSHVPATIVATALITVGCLVNYQLSKYILTDLLLYAIPNQVLRFQQAVSDQGSQNLFNYMLFLRVVAILPSWMINLASPLANVPVGTFISSAVIGFQPQVCIVPATHCPSARLWHDHHMRITITFAWFHSASTQSTTGGFCHASGTTSYDAEQQPHHASRLSQPASALRCLHS